MNATLADTDPGNAGLGLSEKWLSVWVGGAIRHVGEKPKGLIITLVVSWLIKPFSMAALGVESAARCCRTVCADRDVELLRTRGCRCNRTVRPWQRRGAGDGLGRAGRSAGDAVAGGDCQPEKGQLPRCLTPAV